MFVYVLLVKDVYILYIYVYRHPDNIPCIWKETGVPGESSRLSGERVRSFFSHDFASDSKRESQGERF